MNIGNQLKQQRLARQMTQDAVAEQLNVSRTTVSSWETGRTLPDIEKLIRLSGLYVLSLDALVRADSGIMAHIQEERTMLRRYKKLKIVVLIMVGLLVVYNGYWFSCVHPRNQRLAHWTHTAANNYLTKDGYSYQAHDVTYPMFLFNHNIAVSTYQLPKEVFDGRVTIDGDKVILSRHDKNGVFVVTFNRSDFEHKRLKFQVMQHVEFNPKDKVLNDQEITSFLTSHWGALNDVYTGTAVIWRSING